MGIYLPRYRVGNSSKKRYSFKPIFGICNQPKFIPLMYAPLTFEFELCNSATDPIISAFAGATFTPDNTSTSWRIEDVRVICDVCTLDSALQNSYSEHVLSGKALPINYSSYISQYQTLTSSDASVNVTRAVSRLKSIFVTFDNQHTDGAGNGSLVHTNVNTFMGPMCPLPDDQGYGNYYGGAYNNLKELQWQRFARVFSGNKRVRTIDNSINKSANFLFQRIMTSHFDIILQNLQLTGFVFFFT